MNFLSHYYCELPNEDTYFICGIILPDILSNYSKRSGEKIRVHPNKIAATISDAARRIGEGVKRHYAADAMFHSSDFFKTYTGIIEAHIKDLQFDTIRRRRYAFSHVFLELMMDRQLLMRDESVADRLYAHLDTADIGVIERFLSENTPGNAFAGATRHFERFRNLKFIYHYADNGRLTGIMDELNQSIGNPPFNNTDNAHMQLLIHRIDTVLVKVAFPNFVKA